MGQWELSADSLGFTPDDFGPKTWRAVWDDHWVYWLGPLIDGGLAALVYYLTFMWGREEE